jgi:uncharacterized repeat protein (TIGR03803 family)
MVFARTHTSFVQTVRVALVGVAAAALAGCAASHSAGAPFAPAVSAPALDARATGYASLYLFKGGADGANPFAGLVSVKGSFYGVTYGNKLGTCANGTVYEVSSAGKERVLYCFKGMPDGAQPVGNLIAVNGSLYGTTFNGGAHNLGSVFAITPAGKEHVVYSFAGGKDGTNPGAGLTVVNGELYGTTIDAGGAETGNGTVFKVSTSGKESVLYTFKGFPTDGESPYAGLTLANGTLYGTTETGGANRYGTAFSITTSGKEKVLYSFKGPGDGSFPYGNLLFLGGAFYGTTYGSTGTIFTMTTAGAERAIYTFKGPPSDGEGPRAGLTLLDGVLYGVTENGGANDVGTIFETTRTGAERVLYSFKDGTKDGANPYGALIGVSGVLYGTTLNGGVSTPGVTNHPNAGSIFKFAP